MTYISEPTFKAPFETTLAGLPTCHDGLDGTTSQKHHYATCPVSVSHKQDTGPKSARANQRQEECWKLEEEMGVGASAAAALVAVQLWA